MDETLSDTQRDAAVDDLIGLVGAVDAILQAQAAADAGYFFAICGRSLSATDEQQVRTGVLRAYRWQYIVSGVQEPRFSAALQGLTTEAQMQRIASALGPMMQ